MSVLTFEWRSYSADVICLHFQFQIAVGLFVYLMVHMFACSWLCIVCRFIHISHIKFLVKGVVVNVWTVSKMPDFLWGFWPNSSFNWSKNTKCKFAGIETPITQEAWIYCEITMFSLTTKWVLSFMLLTRILWHVVCFTSFFRKLWKKHAWHHFQNVSRQHHLKSTKFNVVGT